MNATEKKELYRKRKIWGAMGGRKRTIKKKLASKITLPKANKGREKWKLIRQIEGKMLKNREEHTIADDYRRSVLDAKFAKWMRLREQLMKNGGK